MYDRWYRGIGDNICKPSINRTLMNVLRVFQYCIKCDSLVLIFIHTTIEFRTNTMPGSVLRLLILNYQSRDCDLNTISRNMRIQSGVIQNLCSNTDLVFITTNKANTIGKIKYNKNIFNKTYWWNPESISAVSDMKVPIPVHPVISPESDNIPYNLWTRLIQCITNPITWSPHLTLFDCTSYY